MAVPTIYSVTPGSGHSGGGQLITIYGANFHVPAPYVQAPPNRIHGPWPTGASAGPLPFVPGCAVYFGADLVPATNVGVLHPGIIQCTTPVHDPSGIPLIDPTPNRAGQIAVPPSDVTVVNLDSSGNPVPGESFTLPQSYSFLRPNLTVNGVLASVIGALILDLQRQIIPQVEFNPHTDYDATSGDALNITFPAALPGLAILNLKTPQAQGRPRAVEEEVTFVTSTGYQVKRLAVIRDLLFTVLGVSDSQQELLNLDEAVEVYFRNTGGIFVPANSANPALGMVNFPVYRETDTIFTGRISTSNVVAFTFSMRVAGVPMADMPGLTQDSIALGAQFAGSGTWINGVFYPGGSLVVQATQ